MAEEVTIKQIERKYLAHYINCTPDSNATYERLGKDLEEFNVELNPEIKTTKNILGETSVKLTSYEVSASVEPYYAEQGTKLFEFLQGIVDERKTLDGVITDVVEVHTWEQATGGAFTAYKETAVVAVSSYGGNYEGYAIPFTVHYAGDRTKGTFNPTTKTFTAESVA